jgi:hypothetical protein
MPVALNMREWDRREIYANRFDENPLKLASEAVAMGQDVGWVAGLEEPIAAFGCFDVAGRLVDVAFCDRRLSNKSDYRYEADDTADRADALGSGRAPLGGSVDGRTHMMPNGG